MAAPAANDANDGKSRIGLWGLAVMGQNFALNIASKGFGISVTNRSDAKVLATVERAKQEKLDDKLRGFTDKKAFIDSLAKPRSVIILVKAGKPVDDTIEQLLNLMEEGDLIIDGGNEWYENTERRAAQVEAAGLQYMGMGISGGEEGARFGPSLMPGGSKVGFDRVADVLMAAACTTADGTVCCAYLGEGGAGNYVKMVHNGIEYGDMQLIAEAYDLLKNVGGLSNAELSAVFAAWNEKELDSFLIEITANIFKKKDDMLPAAEGKDLVDAVLDKTGQKGTGLWTVKESAGQGIAAPTISAALTARNLSALKAERQIAAQRFPLALEEKAEDALDAEAKKGLIDDVAAALYASKICSYTQGMNLIRAMGLKKGWKLDLGKIAAIWKGGCIIRAQFLDRITAAYVKDATLSSLLMDEDFSKEIKAREAAWRRVVVRAVQKGVATPAFSASLAYFDSYRRADLPANLTQAQRDYFGAHTYQRKDGLPGNDAQGNAKFVHSEWTKLDARHADAPEQK